MPSIDVTQLLSDPFIAGEAFCVIRRPDIVGSDGVTTIGSQTFFAVGSITPTGANSMLREEAFTSATKTIRVMTTFMLRGPSKDPTMQNFQPDLVLWRGDSYIVRTLEDFSRYGAGMIIAECSSIDYVDNAPHAPPLLDSPGE